MNKFVTGVTIVGMTLLGVGLIFAIAFETTGVDLAQNYAQAFGKMPPAYVAANAFWAFGALILIVPPAMAKFQILVVLQCFLTVSGVMAYWQPESLTLKILSRVTISLIAVGYLKRQGLLEGFTFPWSLFDPRFYVAAMREGDSRALAVGLEMLGIGYALGSMFMLTLGSVYLVRSSWISWKKTEQPIFMAWTGLNVAYTTAGCIILCAQILR